MSRSFPILGTALTARHSRTERLLGKLTLLRVGEGRSVLLFALFAFLILVAYYILKTLREPLLLVKASAEMKSYAYATIAMVLLVIIPLYSQLFRRTSKQQLTRWVTIFFIATLLVFYALGRAGVDIGFAYYVWVGIASLMLTAQFWGYAADTYNVISGQRLFPVIMLGGTLGGLVGPILAGVLYPVLGPWNLMLLVGLLLGSTLLLVSPARHSVPQGSRDRPARRTPHQPHPMGGLAMVFQDRYLLLLAALIVLLNWVNTTGEYILAELVVRHAEQRTLADPDFLKGDWIAGFYSQFYFLVNALTVVIQVLLVSRVFRWIGLRGAVVVLPVIACIGYGFIAFVPVFFVIRLVKILENATDYSLMNTARHALYLPLSDSHKFEGKTAIETFFWRLGDLIQAGVVFAGLHWLNFDVEQFALLNLGLSLAWVMVARKLGSLYACEASAHSTDRPPEYTKPVGPVNAPAGRVFEVGLPADCFTDPDPGDVITIRARGTDGSALPAWLSFDAKSLNLRGRVPDGLSGITELLLIARDFDGKEGVGKLVLVHDNA